MRTSGQILVVRTTIDGVCAHTGQRATISARLSAHQGAPEGTWRTPPQRRNRVDDAFPVARDPGAEMIGSAPTRQALQKQCRIRADVTEACTLGDRCSL